MKRWVVAGTALCVLACGGFGGHSEFAISTAEMLASENDDVECKLASTGGGTTTLLDWEYTWGDPEVRPYVEEMKPVKDVWGKVIGQRTYMMVIPVTIENTLPKRRKHDRIIKYHRTDGQIFDAQASKIPKWVKEKIGKPNLIDDPDPFAPNESRETFVMLSVDTPESAVGSVIRMWYTEQRPNPNNPRRTYQQVQDQFCVEVAGVTEVDAFPEP